MLRQPWKNALIIRMFDKGIGYLQLKRRLKTKWALTGDFSLIDIGCDYYVTRFTNLEDYEHVMLNGPWMIDDNYLVIREWVPNFVPEEDKITKLTAWVRIPKLSVEYFNKHFLLHKIGQKIGRVLRVDSTTENVERGQYTRMCVEVDLTKPLLSKFKLNGRIWGIQYEGLKMICFKCGRQGHKEDVCGVEPEAVNEDANRDPQKLPPKATQDAIAQENYGSWMIVKRTTRRNNTRQQTMEARGPDGGGTRLLRDRTGRSLTNSTMERAQNRESNIHLPQQAPNKDLGSRFRVLTDLDLNMAAETNEGDSTPTMEVPSHANPDVSGEENIHETVMAIEDAQVGPNQGHDHDITQKMRQHTGPETSSAAHTSLAPNVQQSIPRLERRDTHVRAMGKQPVVDSSICTWAVVPMGIQGTRTAQGEVETQHIDLMEGDPPDFRVANDTGQEVGLMRNSQQLDPGQQMQNRCRGGQEVFESMDCAN